ncbi:MAG TPA: response regulator transcription factor [Candidatus Deferrimicrobiaceae bacterium]|nr:response regulator transcription factor [Candidatus Deferrimicrobiaceae bacterium]
MVRIFLVDDNAMIRSQLRAALEKQHDWIVVGEAEDGRHALEHWGEHSPSLTLMDFVMPEMDGLEAGRRLTEQHPEAPVLMVTIDPSRQLEQEAKRAGIKGLCKKSDLGSVIAAIDAVLQGNTYFTQSPAAA